MIRALFKKQMMESFSWLYFSRKTGKKRGAGGIAAYTCMYLVIFGMLGSLFYTMAEALCRPLSEVGLGWLYFAIVSLVAVIFGVFGSAFNTFASLYKAKDNDLLFSMPIPAPKILLMRLSGVYAMGLMYELIVLIPSLCVWFTAGSVSPAGIAFSALMPFVLSFLVLSLSCVLGFAVALVSAKVQNKNAITVLLSLAFFAGYYYVYSKAYQMLAGILANAQNAAQNVKIWLYPFYHMGLAAEGNPLSMLIFTAIIAAVFALVYLVLSRRFIRLAATNKGAAKIRYKEKRVKAGSAGSALLKKEFKRFTGSPAYMLNCGLGIILMPVAGAALLVKRGALAGMLSELYAYAGVKQTAPLLIAAALCMIASINDISAPSVSLEGKTLWLVQVLPVSPWQVLKAKLKLHLILTLPPAAVLTGCALAVFKPDTAYMVLIPLTVAAFIAAMAMFGLCMNLKAPRLHWTSEAVPIKQSLSVTAAIFGGWAVVLVFGALYFALSRFVSAFVYLICVCALLLLAAAALCRWLKNTGSKIFAAL